MAKKGKFKKTVLPTEEQNNYKNCLGFNLGVPVRMSVGVSLAEDFNGYPFTFTLKLGKHLLFSHRKLAQNTCNVFCASFDLIPLLKRKPP